MNIDDKNDDTHAARCLRAVDQVWSTLPRWQRDARANSAMETDTERIKEEFKGEELTGAIFARRQSIAAGHFWRNKYRLWW